MQPNIQIEFETLHVRIYIAKPAKCSSYIKNTEVERSIYEQHFPLVLLKRTLIHPKHQELRHSQEY